ncbi:MAG: FliM/FliN family flagellar motor switch protein [Gammaproteobacteria bacterium]|nr:FliM/FliN family flagellar motor switch protein [Gammaproteobacteria bacterium]
MTDKVLTDEEKDALLEGVSSGAVEVHGSGGPSYASVKPFEIGPRSRIVSDSFPRLHRLNLQLADELAGHASSMVQRDVNVTAVDLEVITFGEFVQKHDELSFVVTFLAPPMDGRALLTIDASLVRQLVECFFGGEGGDVTVPAENAFTDGEMSVARLFSNIVLSVLKEAAVAICELSPEPIATHTNLDLVEVSAGTDRVISSEFEIAFGGHQSSCRLMWPIATIRPLLPVFEGQKKERDAARDLLWAKELKRRIADTPVELVTTVGHAGLRLADLVGLQAGDMIEIENPGLATVYAKDVPVLHGRFGVHQGHNAVEARNWVLGNEMNDSEQGKLDE